MVKKRYINIVGFGLIVEDDVKGPFRHVEFGNSNDNEKGEIILYKKERPSVWLDVLKVENGGTVAPYKGYVTRYNAVNIVVFEGETVDQAYEQQKWKLNIKGKLSTEDAEFMREDTKGYITNLTHQGAMEISWRKIEKKARLIKFRVYEGLGEFNWTNWYEIMN